MKWKLLRKISNRIHIFFNKIEWKKFRKKHLPKGFNLPNYITTEDAQIIDEKEQRIQEVIKMYSPSSFLEVGIGGEPVLSRMKIFNDKNIKYTGCDFQNVCDIHTEILKTEGISLNNITFIGNNEGTYCWNLFKMIEQNKKFDMIYIDGHHTFYVDFPTFVLCDYLLKDGGYLLVDDIKWTLDFMKGIMGRFFWQWHLYKDAYNFNDYTKEQQTIPHMKMIAEKIMIEKKGYNKVIEWSTDGWYVLQKNLHLNKSR